MACRVEPCTAGPHLVVRERIQNQNYYTQSCQIEAGTLPPPDGTKSVQISLNLGHLVSFSTVSVLSLIPSVRGRCVLMSPARMY